ncbi:Serine-rich 25 kDa antigen protein [Labeo rohita]|uniref:Serine-rich 25 kDa antigen protein n=1 Tax=Labeo rohita TaxID=84645 RepID=A0ABQ8LKC5_LABRO|nr:Serine-rich 25 kDa antigen protein [Labeo rohita]
MNLVLISSLLATRAAANHYLHKYEALPTIRGRFILVLFPRLVISSCLPAACPGPFARRGFNPLPCRSDSAHPSYELSPVSLDYPFASSLGLCSPLIDPRLLHRLFFVCLAPHIPVCDCFDPACFCLVIIKARTWIRPFHVSLTTLQNTQSQKDPAAFPAETGKEECDNAVMAAVRFSQPQAPGYSSLLIATPVCKPASEMAATPERAHVMAATAERQSCKVTAGLHEPSQVTAGLYEPSQVTAAVPGSSLISAGHPESSHISSDHPEPRHVSSDRPEPRHISSDTPRSRPIMMASVLDPPLVSVWAASIPVASAPLNPTIKESAPEVSSVHKSAPEVSSVHKSAPEVSSVHKSSPEVLSVHKSAPEVSSVHKSAPEVSSDHESAPVPPEVAVLVAEPPKGATDTTIESPVVAAFATEPLEVAASTAASSAALMPATVSPEVAAETAEPYKMGRSAITPCTVVAPSNTHLACVFMPGPELATEAVYELSVCPVPTMEAINELSARPVTAIKAVSELSARPVTAMEAINELSARPVTAMEAISELSTRPVTAMEAINELSARPVTTIEAVIELSAPSISSAPTETAVKPTVFPASLLFALSASSVPVFPRSQSMLWVFEPPWWVPGSPAVSWGAPGPPALPWRAPAPPWRAPGPSAPPWRAPGPSVPPWWAPAPSTLPWVSSVLLWWSSAPPWGSSVASALLGWSLAHPARSVLPQSPDLTLCLVVRTLLAPHMNSRLSHWITRLPHPLDYVRH